MVGSQTRLYPVVLISAVTCWACTHRGTDAIPPVTTENLSSPEVSQRLLSACSELVTDWLDDGYTSVGFGGPTPSAIPAGYSFVMGDAQDLSDANPSMILECSVVPEDEAVAGPVPIIVMSTTGQPLVIAVPG
jgi:hypothetical protein